MYEKTQVCSREKCNANYSIKLCLQCSVFQKAIEKNGKVKGRATNVSSLVLNFSYEWGLGKLLLGIYYKTGKYRSDHAALHLCKILAQTPYRKTTAGADLIKDMDEVLYL